MKTNITFDEKFASVFKKDYRYSMGGTQTVVLPNGQSFFFDDRQYYKGRGEKYNSTIRHDIIGDVLVTKKQVNERLKIERQYRISNKKAEIMRKKKQKRIEQFAKKGLYNIITEEYGTFVELSDYEAMNKTFDAKRLANTLKISVEDAELLKSTGKTYVYAKTADEEVIELYHSDLDCNYLCISIQKKAQQLFEEKLNQRADWVNAQFAELVGQTDNRNHFVC